MTNEIKLKELKSGELFTIHPHHESIYQFTGRLTHVGKDFESSVMVAVCRPMLPFFEYDQFFDGETTLVSPVKFPKSKQISDDSEITKAIKLFQKEINNDEDFYRSYKDNIAICLYDSKAGSLAQCNQYADILMRRIFGEIK